MAQVSALGSFRIAKFRFQWHADLSTSWAFEMQTLILGWYVLLESGSVLRLTPFASLQHFGTLTAPMPASCAIASVTARCSVASARYMRRCPAR